MKILLLNPFIDAQHGISLHLKRKGVALIFPANAAEAWKMIQLHGANLDLAIIHREPTTDFSAPILGEGNFLLLARIKGDPAHADLAVIATSSQWDDGKFAEHQAGSCGANAYLRWPFVERDLDRTIEQMFGAKIEHAAQQTTSTTNVAEPEPSGSAIVLEETKSTDYGTATRIHSPSSSAPTSGSGSTQDTGGIPFHLDPAEGPSMGTPGTPSLVLDAPISPEAPTRIASSVAADANDISLEMPDSILSPEISVSVASEVPTTTAASNTPPLTPEEQGLSIQLDGGGELEPHERLMLANAAKTGISTSTDGSAPQENATKVLDLNEGPEIELSPTTITEGTGPVVSAGPSVPPPPNLSDDELAVDLPYLFSSRSDGKKEQNNTRQSMMMFAEAVGDAVVPGGAAQTPDVDTMKRYLMLREQDVAVLSNQLRAAREQVDSLGRSLREEQARSSDLDHQVGDMEKRMEDFEREKQIAIESLSKETDELRFQNKTKTDKVRLLEAQVREASDEIERLKERVRLDIRKIRVRERELENKLEIMKKDSEALIAARETKIIELKRKVDLLEFNMDLLQDQYAREKDHSAQLRERLGKAAQVVRVAGGLLDSPSPGSSDAAGNREAS